MDIDRQLTHARLGQVALMGDRCAVLERSTGRDAGGGLVPAYSVRTVPPPPWAEDWPPAPLVPLRLGPPTAAELTVVADRLEGRPLRIATLPHGVPLAEGDLLAVVVPGDAVLELEVVALYSEHGTHATAVRAGAVEAAGAVPEAAP